MPLRLDVRAPDSDQHGLSLFEVSRNAVLRDGPGDPATGGQSLPAQPVFDAEAVDQPR